MMARKRKIPERKCVVTDEMKPKKELFVSFEIKKEKFLSIRLESKMARGAYLSRRFSSHQ